MNIELKEIYPLLCVFLMPKIPFGSYHSIFVVYKMFYDKEFNFKMGFNESKQVLDWTGQKK